MNLGEHMRILSRSYDCCSRRSQDDSLDIGPASENINICESEVER